MAFPILQLGVNMMCPHGAKVNPIPTNFRVKVGGAFALLATDQYLVAGCPFTLPGVPPIPSPCLTVKWLTFSLRVKVTGKPVLLQNSVGLCFSPMQVPQGPVVIAPAQMRVKGM